ncbi:MAG: tetratricopeptide repeat protein [Candidatus Pacebacteria bacterium]|nr:tetratricopeptide repeat protein [Candidatus Paceibacterota bacterium]
MTNTKDIGIIVALLFVMGFIVVNFSGKVSSSVVENADVSGSYSLEGLTTEYEERLALDENDKDALFSLARIYYIGNQTEKSLAAIAQYKELYPEEKRIYYISGLANAYGGNLRVAELEFLEFIDSGLSRWPGYLDLAWVYFQQGEFDQSQEKLDIALENFGSNMWLNTSRGAVALAQGEGEEALRYLYRAREQAKTVTAQEWRENYSFNDQLSSKMKLSACAQLLKQTLPMHKVGKHLVI